MTDKQGAGVQGAVKPKTKPKKNRHNKISP